MHKKRFLKSLKVSYSKLVTAFALAVTIIIVQIIVPILIQSHVSATMFCGDLVKQIDDNFTRPMDIFVENGNNVIPYYRQKWALYAAEAEKTIQNEKK